MAISFACPCGQDLEIDDVHAGQPVACPTCERTVTAPRKRAAVTVVAPPPETPPAPYTIKPTAVRDDPEDDDRPKRFSQSKSRKEKSEFKDPAMRELMSKARAKDREDEDRREKQRQSGNGGTFGGGAIGGIIAMAVAVVWFVGGLAAGIIFFYPPILFVLGLVTFLRGLMGHDD